MVKTSAQRSRCVAWCCLRVAGCFGVIFYWSLELLQLFRAWVFNQPCQLCAVLCSSFGGQCVTRIPRIRFLPWKNWRIVILTVPFCCRILAWDSWSDQFHVGGAWFTLIIDVDQCFKSNVSLCNLFCDTAPPWWSRSKSDQRRTTSSYLWETGPWYFRLFSGISCFRQTSVAGFWCATDTLCAYPNFLLMWFAVGLACLQLSLPREPRQHGKRQIQRGNC